MTIHGIHHITAIASDPQRNLDFYTGLLGLRLVKRTINFDDPASYHFYFGDSVGTPGTILTFFPWPFSRRGTRGGGEIEATALTIPEGSVSYWLERFKEYHVSAERAPERFGEEVIRLADTDGMYLELIASKPSSAEIKPWAHSSVPPEHSIRGIHGVSATVENHLATSELLMEIFGYRLAGETGNRFRFVASDGAGAGTTIDLLRKPGGQPGQLGAGSVHHIAFRVTDDAQQSAWREKLISLGFSVSPIKDRVYFHSIYFREPGGVLFEIATDPPGFTKDETIEELGSQLCLPPWMEPARPRIEGMLPTIVPPETGLKKAAS